MEKPPKESSRSLKQKSHAQINKAVQRKTSQSRPVMSLASPKEKQRPGDESSQSNWMDSKLQDVVSGRMYNLIRTVYGQINASFCPYGVLHTQFTKS